MYCLRFWFSIRNACMHTHTHTHTHTHKHARVHTHTQASMDLPEDKKAAVMESSNDKKWQLVRDNTRRRRQLPPMEYISKLQHVMETEGLKKVRRKTVDASVIHALQSLEISLRTNDIRSVCVSSSFQSDTCFHWMPVT